MSAYDFGYATGIAASFLLVSWLVLKAVTPSSFAGFNLTVGIIAVIVLAGQFSEPSATRLLGSLVSAGAAYLLLYRFNARRSFTGISPVL